MTRPKAGSGPSGRAERRLARDRAKRHRRLGAVAGSVVVVAATALGLIGIDRSWDRIALPPIAVAPASPAPFDADARALGDPAAPVVVVEWGDYQ